MKIAGEYSFNSGKQYIEENFPTLLIEVRDVINSINKEICKNKKSKEKTMPGKMLYSPSELNKQFKNEFFKLDYKNYREPCNYPTQYYTEEYDPVPLNNGAFRDMDFVKDELGIEVQFGKYSFMVYNVCAKMTIFKNLGIIKAGIEIVPIKNLADEMSSGVSYFEQFVWDLDKRGVSNIDIPVLILGIT